MFRCLLRQLTRKVLLTGVVTASMLMFAIDANAAMSISSADWNSKNNTLSVKGSDGSKTLVTVTNADTGTYVGEDNSNKKGNWSIRVRNPASVPCRVHAENPSGEWAEADVTNAPADCEGPPECTVDADCDNGSFCDGAETCNNGSCQAGSAQCTGPGETCDEANDVCVQPECVEDADCDNGVYCDGQEACVNFTCQPGTDPCNAGEVCDEATASCSVPPQCTVDADCDNGTFCDGAETCNAGTCVAGAAPCTGPGETCDEAGNTCVAPECTQDADCASNGLFCDGTEICVNFTCQSSGNPCAANEVCDETGDVCNASPISYQCSDGQDNDGDGQIDFPNDPGCADPSDDDETDVAAPAFGAQTDFKILMNYELGMHCTGFEFAYCCVLPAYNSILAQVVKPDGPMGFPTLLEGDPNIGKDALGRETVVRDKSQSGGQFNKYVLRYWHDAQPRNDGLGKVQGSTLISAVEGNSLMSWNSPAESAVVDGNNALQYDANGMLIGDGINTAADNYQNAVWNHLYFYQDLEGTVPGGTTAEADKIRLGVAGNVIFPPDCGPALHPMGPVTTGGNNDCGSFSNGNVLTFSGDTGTVVYTQMKVLENLPIMLTSPKIWEALGLPLTPFEDSIDFFTDPGLVDEDSVRPFVAMKAQLHNYAPGAYGGIGSAVTDGNGNPVIGFGTAPIDIPNCERCHSNGPDGTVIQNSVAEGGGTLTVANSPNNDSALYTLVQAEYDFWSAYYNIDTAAGDSDWYARLKSAAISMLVAHDEQHGTGFGDNYPGCGSLADPNDTTGCGATPQSTRMGNGSVICQRCHADNVIAVVKSATHNDGNGDELIPPISEAIHNNHRGTSNGGPIVFADANGRDGSCQGCHPAHRSNGGMMGYPITLAGTNKYAAGDNRDASGGCFVGRDVHSNPNKDNDGVGTPAHLNAVGSWLATNVFDDQGANGDKGIWCTNCHNQLGQEMWKAENMTDLVNNVGTSPRQAGSLAAVATAVGVSTDQAIAWLDPNANDLHGTGLGDMTAAIWDPDPGLCNYVAGAFGVIPVDPAHDGNVATVEVNVNSAAACSTGGGSDLVDCGAAYPGAPSFHICGTVDGDGDFSVNILDFCTTDDCVTAAGTGLPAGSVAVPVPFSAATDGRDHWLSAGEPHCADCHAAPYVEQSGNINAFPPFNYPRKASLMRYSKGHQGITCQGCHESIHGLYPVTPNIDTTSYAQAAALNADGSHGPLKCATCHASTNEIPDWLRTSSRWDGGAINNLDSAATWAHTYTDEANPLDSTCLNCHGMKGTNWSEVSATNSAFVNHPDRSSKRHPRGMMDKAEMAVNNGVVFGFTRTVDGAGNVTITPNVTQRQGICSGCHSQEYPSGGTVSCTTDGGEWLDHLSEGRVSQALWEDMSPVAADGTRCSW